MATTKQTGTTRDKQNKSFVDSPSRGIPYSAQEVFVGNAISTVADDSFGRIKVAPPQLLFDVSFQYTAQDQIFVKKESNGATIIHNITRASMVLSCDDQIGSQAKFRTINYFPYSPAFTNTVVCSFNMNGSEVGVVKRIGLYDDNNGYFVEVDETGLSVNIRSSISGVVVDNKVYQSDFNIDKLDGTNDNATNPSGYNLDLNKQQIMFLEFQWLGSGKASFGFNIDGKTFKCHEFYHANNLTSLYSQTATLPIQAEIICAGGSGSFEFTCASLSSNGAIAQHGHLYSVSSNSTPKNLPVAGVTYPVLAIKKKDGFTNVPVQIINMAAFSTTNDNFLIEVIIRPQLINPVWVDVPGSIVQYDTLATAFTGGRVVTQFYMRSNASASQETSIINQFWDLILGSDIDNNSDIFLLAAKPLSTNANIFALINFKTME